MWQVFIDPERRENAKKVRKLLVDRYNLIEGKIFVTHTLPLKLTLNRNFSENSIEKKKRRTGKKVRMHHDWRLFDACRTGDENELLGLLQDGVNPNLRGTNSTIT